MLTQNNWGACPIPIGWKAHCDASGLTFYYNKTINQWALLAVTNRYLKLARLKQKLRFSLRGQAHKSHKPDAST
jgi:hypothetical protein